MESLLLIGNVALKELKVLRDVSIDTGREIADWDYIGSQSAIQEWLKHDKPDICYPLNENKIFAKWKARGDIYEFEIAWAGSTGEELMEIVYSTPHRMISFGIMVAPLEALYALKLSHRYLKDSPHFLKTMRDIQLMQPHIDLKKFEKYKEWLKRREKETYTYSHPNLKQKAETFFDPVQIKYIYEHDTIHIAMAKRGAPAYTKFKDNINEVKVSRKKFDALPMEDKLFSVLEEAYVLAIERSQVPWPGILTPEQSFLKALEKVCTSISSGWWREFAWEHYDDVLKIYDQNYMDIFQSGVNRGIVQLVK